MEQERTRDQSENQAPANDQTPCPNCAQGAAAPRSYIYAIGRIEARFPRLSVEKEFAQVTRSSETAGLTDDEVLYQVLSQRQNRYLARQMCWILTIERQDTYLLQPRDPSDIELFVEALPRKPATVDIDAVIGIRGPIAPPDVCNGLMLPIVFVSQIYSFDVASLIKSIPRPPKVVEKDFSKTANDLFTHIMQMADNAGAMDEHRALNYLALRYPRIYEETTRAFDEDSSLSAIDVRASRLSGNRRIFDVIFSYTTRKTDFTRKSFVRVDVTDEFPFLVSKLMPYFDR